MRRVAFYGGTFDPVHCGHITVAESLVRLFSLDELVFLPAYHAPHKSETAPTSAYHRFAMLVLATSSYPQLTVSTIELDHRQKRYTIDTLPELIDRFKGCRIFFVMGADSWKDIRTWRDWENVLLMTNHIVVTRPGYEIAFDHVTEAVRSRIIDLRGNTAPRDVEDGPRIYVTDAVMLDVSATEIREDINTDERLDGEEDVPEEVAKYIEKYELYR